MKLSTIADSLWGDRAKFINLFLAAVLLLGAFLGAREIWTQEHRWADIVAGMFYRHDFLHPYLGETDYYDKPLLSYWLIAIAAKLNGMLTSWTLRLPSALSGLLAIWSIYQLGTQLKNKQLGLLAGWLLLTTFYFVFWSRTSSADMLNLAGSLFAVSWYFAKKDHASCLDYAVFFVIVALTCLCKGLIGGVIPFFAVLTDIILQKSWREHLRFSVILSAIPALIIYLFPFWASSHFGGATYGENGLYLVYKENILRYFQPFDHQGPLYTYFVYLPIYLLPWSLLLIPALISLKKRWSVMSIHSKWIAWTLLALFTFLTLSGSRRSYYVLPIIPFAILFIADWFLATPTTSKRKTLTAASIVAAFLFLFLLIDAIPAWYYAQFGVNRFATTLKSEATKVQPWNNWNIVMLDGESKLNFYLQLPPNVKRFAIKGTDRNQQTAQSLEQMWPILEAKPANTIFISRRLYATALQPYFTGYRVVELNAHSHLPFLKNHDINAPIAYIPLK